MESIDNYRPSCFLIRKDIDSGFLLYNTATETVVIANATYAQSGSLVSITLPVNLAFRTLS